MNAKLERRKNRIELIAVLLSIVLSTIAILLSIRPNHLTVNLAPLHQVQIPPSLSEDEFRSKQLEIQYRSMEIETRKAWISALATGIPIMLALLTLAGSIWATRSTIIAQFTAKAAELALQGENTPEILNRAKLLAHLYKDLLPGDFIDRVQELQPDKVGRIVTQAPWTSELQKEIIKLLAENPKQRNQIIVDYKSLFPYEFLDRLQPSPQKADDASSQTETKTN